jgi:3-hydroxyacyl-CoA dehydrogenase
MLGGWGVFASNTSTLPISGLAQASTRPEKFVGLHFFSPVHKMKLVEIIRGKATDDETVARAFDFVLALGKTPIVVNDSRGFFTSRVFGTFVMEGAAMLDEGVPAPLIEHAALAAGMPVGPLAVLDETSLALSVHVLDQTAPTSRRRQGVRAHARRAARRAHGQGAEAARARRRWRSSTITRQDSRSSSGRNSSPCSRRAPSRRQSTS